MTLTDRHEGQAAVIAADVAAHRGYADYVREALDGLIELGDPWRFTAEDVRTDAHWCAERDGRDFDPAPNLIPAILGGYARAGRIVRVNDVASTRRSRHGSRIGVWRAAR